MIPTSHPACEDSRGDERFAHFVMSFFDRAEDFFMRTSALERSEWCFRNKM